MKILKQIILAMFVTVVTPVFADMLVTNPVDSVRKILPVGWVIQSVETNTYPSYRPKGNGTAIFIAIENKIYSKQNYSVVVFIMPSDYQDGGDDPTHGEAMTWPARLIATADNAKIYLWLGSPAEDWKTMQSDLTNSLIHTKERRTTPPTVP